MSIYIYMCFLFLRTIHWQKSPYGVTYPTTAVSSTHHLSRFQSPSRLRLAHLYQSLRLARPLGASCDGPVEYAREPWAAAGEPCVSGCRGRALCSPLGDGSCSSMTVSAERRWAAAGGPWAAASGPWAAGPRWHLSPNLEWRWGGLAPGPAGFRLG